MKRLSEQKIIQKIDTFSQLQEEEDNQISYKQPDSQKQTQLLKSEQTLEDSKLSIQSDSKHIMSAWKAGKFVKEKTLRKQNQQEKKEKLGEGSFGEVSKIENKSTGQVRAQKKIKIEDVTDEIKQELEILKSLDHPNILRVYEFYQDSEHFYIDCEYLQHGNLKEQLQGGVELFLEEHAQQVMKQLLSALNYCHTRKRIIHRDIKPDNIMVDSNADDYISIKLIDWGLAYQMKPGQDFVTDELGWGTPNFMAPEVFGSGSGIEGLDKYDFRADIFSAGLVLFEILSGVLPFESEPSYLVRKKIEENKLKHYITAEEFLKETREKQLKIIREIRDSQLENQIKTKEIDFEDFEDLKEISDDCKDFIQTMLTKDFMIRPTAQECLNHPWMLRKFQVQKKSKTDEKNFTKAIRHLQKFKTSTTLQKVVAQYISNTLISQSELLILQKIFNEIDSKSDGVLNPEELKTCLQKLYEKITDEQINEIMSEIDLNHNGMIEFSEFVCACSKWKGINEKDALDDAFELFDRNGDGKITLDEIKHFFFEHEHTTIDDNIWEQVLNEVDIDQNQEIDREEFDKMMKQIIEYKIQTTQSE